MSLESRYMKLAYGKPKRIKAAGRLIDAGSTLGTKIVQAIYFKPGAYGYKIGKKR